MALLSKQSPSLLYLLAAFVALGPLATDMYLPALPGLQAAFQTDIASVQLTLSAYLAGFSCFHLACGPLSDRFGRRPILLVGMLVFMLASIACSLSETVISLTVWRFVQGIGACVGPTLARAMVRDLYPPLRISKALASMNAVMALAPIVAPILGGWMLLLWPWPSIFIFLAIYAGLAIILLRLKVPESLTSKQSLRPSNIVANYSLLLRNPRFLILVIAASCLYAGAFTFVAGSSFILIGFMGVASEDFGYWFTFIVMGYFLGNVFTARYAQVFQGLQLMRAGAWLAMMSSLLMILLYHFQLYHPLTLVLPVALFTCAIGITLPSAMAAALEPFANMAGTASALMGFVQMGMAATGAFIVSIVVTGEPTPLAYTLFGLAGVSCALFYCIPPKREH